MIYSYLFKKEFINCSWDVAHVYEHCFCHTFHEYLLNNGIALGLFGTLSAETFSNVIFVYATFYNKEIAELFEKFVIDNNINDDYICKSLSEIGLEDCSNYAIENDGLFLNQFEAIKNIQWQCVTGSNSAKYLDDTNAVKSPLKVILSPDDFQDVIISYYVENATMDDKALMLRWSMILDDVIITGLGHDMLCYKKYCSPAYRVNDDTIGRTQIVRFSSSEKLEFIAQKIRSMINDFDIKKNYDHIKNHFDEFESQVTWRDEPIVYYKYTNIITNNHNIKSLASLENLISLTNKIEINVQKYSDNLINAVAEQLNK